MPGKMARSDPRPRVRITRDAGSGQHLTSVLQEAGETRTLMPVWDSSGESRLMRSSRAVDCPNTRVLMNFFVEYFKLIDLLALAALAALACAAFIRNRSVWLFVAGILVVIWGAMRITGWP